MHRVVFENRTEIVYSENYKSKFLYYCFICLRILSSFMTMTSVCIQKNENNVNIVTHDAVNYLSRYSTNI